MARKPTPTTDRAPTISAKQAKNALPSDPHIAAVDDLYDEAKLWLVKDFKITTEAEAEGMAKLIKLAREARDAATADHDIEKRPHLDANKEIDDRYRPITTKAQNIMDACNKVLTPWNTAKVEAARKAAEETRKAAEDKAAIAAQAAQSAGGDLGAIEIAQNALDDAKRLTKAANRLDKNAGKGTGLRTIWTANAISSQRREALKHYLEKDPDAFVELLQRLADDDVRAGVRSIPGFTITSHQENV